MKYCSKCGNDLSEGARFCRVCGQPTNTEAEADVATSDVPTRETPVPANAPTVSLSTLVLGGVLLCLVGGGAYFVKENGKHGNTTAESTIIPESDVETAGGNSTTINSPDEERRENCQSNLKQIGLAFAQYTQDYDEKWPTITSGNPEQGSEPEYGWSENLQPYLKSTQIFQCPSEENPPDADPSQQGYTDYYYNLMLAGRSQAVVEAAGNTISSGDGISSDSLYNRTERESRGEPGADTRHLGGANYAFADGHVKWLKPVRVLPSSIPPNSGNATFSIARPFETVESAPVEMDYQGERFPETRLRYLDLADIEDWSFAKVRYALNEIYARHGYSFKPGGAIRKQFQQFSWYAPVAGKSQQEIEQELSDLEKSNLLLLSQRRNDLKNGGADALSQDDG